MLKMIVVAAKGIHSPSIIVICLESVWNYTIPSKCPARRFKGCSTFQELLITPCNGQISPENGHSLATCVRGLLEKVGT